MRLKGAQENDDAGADTVDTERLCISRNLGFPVNSPSNFIIRVTRFVKRKSVQKKEVSHEKEEFGGKKNQSGGYKELRDPLRQWQGHMCDICMRYFRSSISKTC